MFEIEVLHFCKTIKVDDPLFPFNNYSAFVELIIDSSAFELCPNALNVGSFCPDLQNDICQTCRASADPS